jgi:hypothetical protein
LRITIEPEAGVIGAVDRSGCSSATSLDRRHWRRH